MYEKWDIRLTHLQIIHGLLIFQMYSVQENVRVQHMELIELLPLLVPLLPVLNDVCCLAALNSFAVGVCLVMIRYTEPVELVKIVGCLF